MFQTTNQTFSVIFHRPRCHSPNTAEAWRVRHVQTQVPRDLQPTAARGTKAQGGENGGPEGPLSAPARIRDSMGFYGILWVFVGFYGFLWDVISMFR